MRRPLPITPLPDSAPRVLLATLTDWTGITRLPAQLARQGIAVDAIGPPRSRLLQSSWVRPFPLTGGDPSHWLRQLFSFVETHAARYAWLCAVDDELVWQLHARATEPAAQHLLPASGQGLDFLVSKFAFPALAARNGLPAPRTFIHRDRAALLDAAGRIGFPLILKRVTGCGGQSVIRVDDRTQLERLLAGLADQALALQPFIQGRVYGATAVWRRGELLAWLGFEKIHCWPGDFGPASLIRLCAPPDMEAQLHRMGAISGFHGLGGADFIRDGEGRLLALEQHARPNSQFLFAPQAGVDLMAALRAVILGKANVPLQRPAIRDGRRLPMFPQEAERQRARQQWSALRRWCVSARYRDRMPWDDPGLLAADLARLQAPPALVQP